MSGFAKLTRADGPPLWIRRDQVAALTVYKGNTVVVTATDDVDYEVKETPEQVLRKLEGGHHTKDYHYQERKD